MSRGPEPGLCADVEVGLGELGLAAHLSARPGRTVALLGPNGAGKTTMLRVLAGLQPLDAGRVELDGCVWDDPSAGVLVEPRRRSVGVVFQDHLLFPSMTVLDNVAFGLRRAGASRSAARARAATLLERVGIGAELARRRPTTLSGGERQRVGLARALAIEPGLLLLDEPTASLDATNRVAVRRELRLHLDEHPGVRILVTHDPVDAFALASEVVVLEAGKVTHRGSLSEVTARPRSRYVADLVGVNLYRGEARDAEVRLEGGGGVVIGERRRGPVFVMIHPRAVAVHRRPPEGSPRNAWQASVAAVDLERDRARVRLDGPLPLTAEVTAAAAAELELRPGEEVWVAVKATEIEAYDR